MSQTDEKRDLAVEECLRVSSLTKEVIKLGREFSCAEEEHTAKCLVDLAADYKRLRSALEQAQRERDEQKARAEKAESEIKKLVGEYATQLAGFWNGICGECAEQKARAEAAEARLREVEARRE